MQSSISAAGRIVLVLAVPLFSGAAPFAPPAAFQQETILSPGQTSISNALAEIETHLRNGRSREARSKARELVKLCPETALAWTYLGMACVRLNLPSEALQAYEKAISIEPQSALPYMDLALLYASQDQLEKAIACYEKGLSIGSGNGTAYYNYGRILLKKDRFLEAIGALKRALQLLPGDFGAQTALVEALLRARQREEAVPHAQAILDSKGVSSTDLVRLGALLVRGGETDLAKRVLTKALSISPDLPQAHVEISRLYLALNDPGTAAEHARKAVGMLPVSLEANLALAEALISGRKNSAALKHLLGVRSHFEDFAAYQYTLGIALSRVNQYRPAIQAFQKAIHLDPGMDQAHYLLGNIFLGLGELELAEESFKAAITVNPKSALYYNYLARVYELKGDQFKLAARENTLQALVLDSKDIECRERLARWSKEEGDLPRARNLLEELVADSPGYLPARILLASVYDRLELRQQGDRQREVIRRLEGEAQKLRPPPNDP